eukprot:CAMPEP_0178994800 /NCGR_PEP_ID=MMETSP0795-20121207/7472_1 /TAXON_ID=88552 /ORGANISM="Amoebophrya sp., Strain Ameob2" /LENGTH=427 /DNA_ID=CAMNT_0020687035 /DNA_START=48 /DNA_END=1332 /DNA_ORIENTATION=-
MASTVEPAKPRKYRFSISDPDSFETDGGASTFGAAAGRVSGRNSSSSSRISTSNAAFLLENAAQSKVGGRMRGSVFMLEPASGPLEKQQQVFDDGDLEFLKSTRAGSKASTSADSETTASDSTSSSPTTTSTPTVLALSSSSSSPTTSSSQSISFTSEEDVDTFVAYVADLAHESSLLSMVVSGRHDAIRKKKAEKPELFAQPGGYSVRMLGQFADALQVGAYVLLKTKWVLMKTVVVGEHSGGCGRVREETSETDATREHEPDFRVDEAMRAIHGSSSKIAIAAEEISNLVTPKRRSALSVGDRGYKHASFATKFKEFVKNDFEKKRRSRTSIGASGVGGSLIGGALGAAAAETETVGKDEFLACMEQFFALKNHFDSIVHKSNTLQRILDTKLEQNTSLGGAIKVAVAASKLKKLIKPKPQAAQA